MPDLATFEQELIARLQGPVNAYYDQVERSALPESGAGGIFQPLLSRLTVNRAQSRLHAELRAVLTLAYQVAAALGNHERALDELQNQQVLARLAEALNYLGGFIADLKTMSRAQALARIAKYVAPIKQTYSVTATSDLPELPVYPGDPRLICSQKIRACKCYLRVVRIGPNDWDVFWERTAGESCQSCIDLSEQWRPLRIRRGRILAPQKSIAKAAPVVEKSLGNTGAMIALYPPVVLASDLERLAAGVLNPVEKADDLHLTLLFLGDAEPLRSKADALRLAVEQFAAGRVPIEARLNGTARFDNSGSDEGTPFVALVDSPQLPAFRQALFETVTALGIVPVSNHGFIPHITLAYLDNPPATPTLVTPGNAFVFEKLSLVMGDERTDVPFQSPQPVPVEAA